MTILIVYFITLIVSLITYKRYSDTYLAYFPILIAYTFLNELLGFLIIKFPEFSLVKEIKYHTHNTAIYTLYSLIFFSYCISVYHKVFKAKLQKWMCKIACIIVWLVFGVSYFLKNVFYQNFYVSNSIGAFLVVLLIVLYFLQLRKHQHRAYRYNLLCYFSIGMVLSNLYLPIFMLTSNLYPEVYQALYLRDILFLVTSTVYGIFTIGFLTSRRWAFA
ncbi:hypothetical protein [Croceivirga sp. JEA036]|uniref:hypothetical protein n=1 Tax=Croceivirga sp. JEA036 TaxID=2721162 RepID=UPI0016B25259|nr:hypothetical protein [Croceivirga sp. JEA036]NJB37374.1 hypothetical protein [Croceivirga sp. JEA036]